MIVVIFSHKVGYTRDSDLKVGQELDRAIKSYSISVVIFNFVLQKSKNYPQGWGHIFLLKMGLPLDWSSTKIIRNCILNPDFFKDGGIYCQYIVVYLQAKFFMLRQTLLYMEIVLIWLLPLHNNSKPAKIMWHTLHKTV